MPKIVGKANKKLVIVNLQSTPLDGLACLKINGLCDEVVRRVMVKLAIDVPEFIFERRVQIKKTNKDQLSVRGLDSDGAPYQIFKQIVVDYGKNHPFKVLKDYDYAVDLIDEKKPIALKLGFYGHYGEGPYRLDFEPSSLKEGKAVTYLLEFNPGLKKWFN